MKKESDRDRLLLSQETDIDAYRRNPNLQRQLPMVELLPEGVTFSRRKRKLDEDYEQNRDAH
ncbi:MAG TPA: hypothetical protein VGL94_10695 [Ktedonobacteraceae bacterium]